MAGFVPEDNNASHPYTLVRTTPGGFGFVSGVLPYDGDGRVLQERDAAVGAVLDGLRTRLAAAGFALDDVVKTTVFLTDLAWREAVNEAFHAAFAAPRPARSAVQVSALPGGAPIELEAVAVRA
jgi:enamine deaminase RidA (YjgF/YER057c/UK114 family)